MPDRLDPRCQPWPERPGVPRYSRNPFPPYRYLHGLAPHPIANPDGHSHARAEEPAGGEDDYLFGIDLYNHGCWWEAHEAWEAVWLALEKGTPRRFAVQGLIQVANAQLKLELGRSNAVTRLRAKYAELFDKAGAAGTMLGFDLDAWRECTDAYIAAQAALTPMRHDMSAYPVIILATGILAKQA